MTLLPVVAECRYEVNAIELLCKRFVNHYGIQPAFCISSLQEALVSAFNTTMVKERRPLLIYIHHNLSMSTQMFCLNIFGSEIIVEYLLENYIIWPWDITEESNKKILIDIWRETFSSHFGIDLSMEECPMLIGVMRRASRDNNSFSICPYEFKILLEDDILMQTNIKFNRDAFLDMLITFKEEFDENEQYLSFDFMRKTGLCLDVVLEIVKYLSLNDVVTIFSNDILPLLEKCKMILPIVEPTNRFMENMIKNINREQIISLRLKGNEIRSIMESTSSSIFHNVIVVTLLNLQHVNHVNEFKTRLPNLAGLSLRYDHEVDFHSVCKVFNYIEQPMKRFKIHCGYLRCPHRHISIMLKKIKNLNETVEYFVLNVAHASMGFIKNCAQYYATCFLMAITDFIKIMRNVRHVGLIIDSINVDRLFDVKEWTSLVTACHQLEKIRIKIIRNTSEDIRLTENIERIQQELSNVRQNIEFQVTFK
ncbi:unnamed protein product [Rotaria sp. Silwood2]|nr:unnamed protein product [Rotaria sp. Silwood2]CAF2830696.1 unnamed protein product [Rotaria sp. Silwood2]CAF3230975.1 unnamed protein product [Rotaria sp. Silwood2]CAF3263408.1 unnamed protein product [Rotaria sp. Silwood2]CAF3946761.1 unnamed protein product [Rotaria sp. Silwood2]